MIEIAEFFFVSLAATTFDECFGLFESGVALVLVLEVVVKEARMVLEMVVNLLFSIFNGDVTNGI